VDHCWRWFGFERVRALDRHEMHGGVRKVVQPAGMVEVEMREHSMAHVARIEAQALLLAHRGHLLAEFRVEQPEEESAQALLRLRDVAQAEAGVDQHQAGVGLGKQAVARELAAAHERFGAPVHEPAAKRAGGNAIEMVDTHGHLRGVRGSSNPCSGRSSELRPDGRVAASRNPNFNRSMPWA
jgi:hypothetical protein